jgi:hypothetical protein
MNRFLSSIEPYKTGASTKCTNGGVHVQCTCDDAQVAVDALCVCHEQSLFWEDHVSWCPDCRNAFSVLVSATGGGWGTINWISSTDKWEGSTSSHFVSSCPSSCLQIHFLLNPFLHFQHNQDQIYIIHWFTTEMPCWVVWKLFIYEVHSFTLKFDRCNSYKHILCAHKSIFLAKYIDWKILLTYSGS